MTPLKKIVASINQNVSTLQDLGELDKDDDLLIDLAIEVSDLGEEIKESLSKALVAANKGENYKDPRQELKRLKSYSEAIRNAILGSVKEEGSIRYLQKEIEKADKHDTHIIVICENDYIAVNKEDFEGNEFFNGVLRNKMAEAKNNELILPGISKQTFKEIKIYLKMNAFTENSNMVYLFVAAHRFLLKDLEERTFKLIQEKITLQTAKDILGISEDEEITFSILEQKSKSVFVDLPDELKTLAVDVIRKSIETTESFLKKLCYINDDEIIVHSVTVGEGESKKEFHFGVLTIPGMYEEYGVDNDQSLISALNKDIEAYYRNYSHNIKLDEEINRNQIFVNMDFYQYVVLWNRFDNAYPGLLNAPNVALSGLIWQKLQYLSNETSDGGKDLGWIWTGEKHVDRNMENYSLADIGKINETINHDDIKNNTFSIYRITYGDLLFCKPHEHDKWGAVVFSGLK